jgi:hypothetical protein
MADIILLSKAQMRRIEGYFPLSHGIARVDDRRVISGIIFVIRNGLRWRMLRASMVRTRRFITGLCAGAVSASSTRYSPSFRARPASRAG